MTDIQSGADRDRPVRRGLLPLGVAGVTALAALALIVGGPKGSTPAASPSDGGGGGGAIGSCIRFELEILAQQELAFDGTVTAVDGEAVTFAVGTWYRGPGDASVTLTEVGLGSGAVTSVPIVDFEVGARYLVSGAGGIVTGCGYSQPYDDAAAADWASAFGS